MEPAALRGLIRTKLADGRLPLNSLPNVCGGPGNGESCVACEEIVTKDELVVEGISPANGKGPIWPPANRRVLLSPRQPSDDEPRLDHAPADFEPDSENVVQLVHSSSSLSTGW